MVDPALLAGFVAIVLGFVFIPGPATLLTMARSAGSGTRVGVATALGIAAGDVVHTVLAVVGISAIIAASAVLFQIIKYAGAAYLIFLGVRAILDGGSVVTPGKVMAIGEATAFRQAVIAEILNPKTALFFLAFLPQFVRPENGAVWLQLVVLGVVFVLLGLLSTMAFAVGAGGIGAFLRRHPLVVTWQSRIVGGVFCALGLRLAFQER